MYTKTFIVAAMAAFSIPSAQATWCKYFYDAQCQQNANYDVSFDCANPGSFGSGGRYVQCHATKGNQRDCIITRCTDHTCATILNSVQVSPNGGTGPCVDMGGSGFYEQRFS
ncbi:hypothetical protein F5Y17DRAFT_459964 [Xylariaceae sp. FL0594]|nr:hypothetical protein F5Y17DRAFT_459964 [Xylariaceae sp. FL0594]